MWPTELTMGAAVEMLVADAKSMAKELQQPHSSPLTGWALLALALREAITQLYNEQFEHSPPEIKKAIEVAKNRIELNGFGISPDDIVVNHPPAVHSLTCESCSGYHQFHCVLDNLAMARPIWTFLYRHPQ